MLLKYVVEMRNWRTPNLKVLNLIQCHANCKGDLAVRIGRKWTFYTFLYAYQKIQFQYTLDIYRVVSLPKNVCTCRSLSLNNDIPRIPLICVLSIAPYIEFLSLFKEFKNTKSHSRSYSLDSDCDRLKNIPRNIVKWDCLIQSTCSTTTLHMHLLRRENQLFFWCFTLIYIYEDINTDIGIKAGVYDITEKSELKLA